MARFFISYHRQTEQSLAGEIVAKLTAAHHSVFIDTGMAVGTDWAKQIRIEIESCDFFVVLLSAASINREMVQAEVRFARWAQQDRARPRILPVRVSLDGPLDYELEAYLGRLNYMQLRSTGDTQAIVAGLLRAVDTPAHESAASPPLPPVPNVTTSPAPSMDARIATAPGGAVPPEDALYVARPFDKRLRDLAKMPGQSIVIKAARQRGKSTALMQYLAACAALERPIAFIDFQLFSREDLSDSKTLFTSLASAIIEATELPNNSAPTVRTTQEFTKFVQSSVIPALGGAVVLAFDEVDRVYGCSYQEDFFAMLRAWHNKRAHPGKNPWKKLDLALAISTEPHLLIQNGAQSPFNVAETIRPTEFALDECKTLNERYPKPLQPQAVQRLQELVEGHPFLTRLAFHRVHVEGMAIDQLLNHAADASGGPFSDHLRALLARLSEDPQLVPAMKSVIRHGTAEPDLFRRLDALGVVRARDDGTYAPANVVYARFFKATK